MTFVINNNDEDLMNKCLLKFAEESNLSSDFTNKSASFFDTIFHSQIQTLKDCEIIPEFLDQKLNLL